MFWELTKASYTNYLCSSALDLHGPAINAMAYPSFTCTIQYLFQYIFPRPVYMHVKCIIQGSVDVKQRFIPPIYNMCPYVQLCNIFTIRVDMSLIDP